MIDKILDNLLNVCLATTVLSGTVAVVAMVVFGIIHGVRVCG